MTAPRAHCLLLSGGLDSATLAAWIKQHHPGEHIAAYTFLFGAIFQARWPERTLGQSKIEFALILFAGLIGIFFGLYPALRATEGNQWLPISK